MKYLFHVCCLLSVVYLSLLSRIWMTSHRTIASLASVIPTTQGGFLKDLFVRNANKDVNYDGPVIPIYLWPEDKATNASERWHLYTDGIKHSPYLERIHDPTIFIFNNETANSTSATSRTIKNVWVGQAFAGPKDKYKTLADWCEDFEVAIREAQHDCFQREFPSESCYWHIYIVDFEDVAKKDASCPGIEAAMKSKSDSRNNGVKNSGYVHYLQRSIVHHRIYSPKTKWIQVGLPYAGYYDHPEGPAEPINFPSINVTTTSVHRKRNINFPVRTDTIRTLGLVVKEFNESYTLKDSIETLWDRPTDVSHFWLPPRLAQMPDGTWKTRRRHWWDPQFRERVSEVLNDYCAGNNTALTTSTSNSNSTETNATASLNNETYAPTPATTRLPRSCFVRLAGRRALWGRDNADVNYIDQMIRSKIIVVSQRDEWEDHYRFFEAMVSGAMVLTDGMWTLPEGYEEGVSVVSYFSAEDLINKTDYYLNHEEERIAVARAGRKLAMERHRSWHRMEEVIFGKALTVGDPAEA